MPAATVVIATRNRAVLLNACLASLRAQNARADFEIVVVDNGSADETSAVLRRQPNEAPLLRVLRVSEPNRGKARNVGIGAALGEVIIFCDDDTVVPADFVGAHLRAHGRFDPCVVAGPIINIADAAKPIPPAAVHYSRAYFCTCNASARKADLDAVHGFDEQYNLYGWEDTDLGIRLRARGLRRVFDWQAYLYHIKPPSANLYSRRRAQAIEKATMAARFVRKAPIWPVRLATGAYALNYARAAIVHALPLRRLYERARRADPASSPWARFATEALLDAAYVDALKSALRSTRG